MPLSFEEIADSLRRSVETDKAEASRQMAEWLVSADAQESEQKRIATQCSKFLEEKFDLKTANAILLLCSAITKLILIAELRDVVKKTGEDLRQGE